MAGEMKMSISSACRSGLVLSLGFLAGCASHRPPLLSPDSPFQRIDSITLAPLVDARVDKQSGTDIKTYFGVKAQLQLLRKGYPVIPTAIMGVQGELGVEDFKEASSEFIKQLGPAQAHWVLVLCIEDSASKVVFGRTGSAVISGFLFNKTEGVTLWSGKGLGQAGAGGLVGLLISEGSIELSALEQAITGLFASIPSRGGQLSVSQDPEPESEHATIYVLRPQGFNGGGLRPKIAIDDTAMGELEWHSNFIAYVPAGDHHVFVLDSTVGNSVNRYDANVKAGTKYFWRWKADRVDLELVDERRGNSDAAKCRLLRSVDMTKVASVNP